MTTRFKVAGTVALALAGSIAVAGQTQSPPQTPTFRTEVEYVEVDALVTDGQGNFVRDLTVDDFEVLEDGRPQKVVNFSLVDIPMERLEAPAGSPLPSRVIVETDIATNEEPFSGRVYVMLLDDLHTDFTRTQQVRRAARQFIEQFLGPNDLMSIVHVGGGTSAGQEFTNNRRRLLQSVDAFIGRKLPSSTILRNEEFYRMSTFSDPMELERAYNARASMNMLQRVAEWFGSVRGRRKTILFFTEGIGFDLSDALGDSKRPENYAVRVLSDIREAVAVTARSNVSIYAIDPRGLSLGDDTITLGSLGDTGEVPDLGIGDPNANDNIRQGSAIARPDDTTRIFSELFLSQQSLRQLSEETNGFAVINRNSFSDAFDRIVRDNSTYYVLAYYPPSSRRDGRFHRIQVRVKRPGLTVRARRGYVAPRGNPPEPRRPRNMSPELAESLASPLPVTGLRMRAFAAPFRGDGSNASVILGIELVGQDLTLTENGRIELAYVAVDTSGRPRAERHDGITTNLRPETRERVQQTGLRFINRFELPPGRYHVRVAAHDQRGETSGSLIYDLDVPDFDDFPLSISGILLTSMSGSAMVSGRADEELMKVLPAMPIAIREFPQNDEIALFAEVYDRTSSTPHRVDIVTTVRGADGTVYFNAQDERDSSELGGARGSYGHALRIPVGTMPVGDYVLTLEARSRAGNQDPAVREVPFRVVPPIP